ncbi:hypothetical protein M758_UG270800 [Ceratodon purpureus]|nr:hypothetical protein M758_UG270800 [Ceratodon purpureus]
MTNPASRPLLENEEEGEGPIYLNDADVLEDFDVNEEDLLDIDGNGDDGGDGEDGGHGGADGNGNHQDFGGSAERCGLISIQRVQRNPAVE